MNSVPSKFSGESIEDDKKRGEWAEMRFMARASEHRLQVSKPFGDSARYDFAVEANGRFLRVQVKSTICRYRGGYLCRIKHGKECYTAGEVDFFAAYVIREDAWYILPAKVVTDGASSLILKPRLKGAKYEEYKEAWHLLRESLFMSTPEASPAHVSDPVLVPTDNCQPTIGNHPGDIGEMRGAVDPPPAVGYDHDLIRRRVAGCFERILKRR